jgi:hypothetical protein
MIFLQKKLEQKGDPGIMGPIGPMGPKWVPWVLSE